MALKPSILGNFGGVQNLQVAWVKMVQEACLKCGVQALGQDSVDMGVQTASIRRIVWEPDLFQWGPLRGNIGALILRIGFRGIL